MENQQSSHFRKHWLAYFLLILLIGSSTYLWFSKDSALKTQQSIFVTEKVAYQKIAQRTLDSLNKDQLTTMMKTLVWAVRSELVRDNVEQVDQYFRQFVKTKAVSEVMLINGEGKIELSTNKKVEGEPLETSYVQAALTTDDVLILDGDQAEFQIIAPVMSLNNRLGTLIVIYHRPELML